MFFILVKELKERWIEFFLGALVVALVVAAFVIQHSLSQSAEKEIHGLAHNLGSNMLIVPAEMDMTDFYSFKYGSAIMPDTYPKLARDSGAGGHIKMSQPVLYGNAVKNGIRFTIIGSTPEGYGSPEEKNHPPRTFITEPFAKQFGITAGSNYTLNGLELNAERILDAGGKTPDYGVIMPLETAQKILGKRGKINALYLGGCWCSIDVPALGRMIESALPGTRAITVAGTIEAQKGAIAVMTRYSTVFYAAAMIIVSGIILLIVLSQFKKHIRETGILIALGASGELISRNLFVKAGIMGILGGLAGYLIGIPLSEFVGMEFLGLTIDPGTDQIVPVLIVSVFSSFIGGFIPAYKISRMDPVESLREV